MRKKQKIDYLAQICPQSSKEVHFEPIGEGYSAYRCWADTYTSLSYQIGTDDLCDRFNRLQLDGNPYEYVEVVEGCLEKLTPQTLEIARSIIEESGDQSYYPYPDGSLDRDGVDYLHDFAITYLDSQYCLVSVHQGGDIRGNWSIPLMFYYNCEEVRTTPHVVGTLIRGREKYIIDTDGGNFGDLNIFADEYGTEIDEPYGWEEGDKLILRIAEW